MPPRRVVLDTNTVLMPITNASSNDSWLVGEWHTGNIIPLTSEATETELLETLRKPRLGIREEDIDSMAATYLGYCERVEIPEPPPETPPCDDPSDQKFIILAYQAGADALVSRDRKVLALREESDIPILTWQEFIALLANT